MSYWRIVYKKYDSLYQEVLINLEEEKLTREKARDIGLKNNISSYIDVEFYELIADVSLLDQQQKEHYEKENQSKVAHFLKQLKESDETMIHIFTSGSCYKLCKILKSVYASAKALYSIEEGHWITEIDGRYYDIGGEITKEYVIGKVYEYSPELEASADIPTYSNNVGVVYGKYV